MEQKLTSSNITLILVTHDRVFMEAVCTGVLELDLGVMHTHAFGGPGSYDRFCQVCNRRAEACYVVMRMGFGLLHVCGVQLTEGKLRNAIKCTECWWCRLSRLSSIDSYVTKTGIHM